MSEQPVVDVIVDSPVVEVQTPSRPDVIVDTGSVQGPKGDTGPPGSAGGALVERSVLIPTTEVTIVHGLLYHPSVRFVTLAGEESRVHVEHPIPGTTVVTSVLPMTGRITLS